MLYIARCFAEGQIKPDKYKLKMWKIQTLFSVNP